MWFLPTLMRRQFFRRGHWAIMRGRRDKNPEVLLTYVEEPSSVLVCLRALGPGPVHAGNISFWKE